jgi:hypothetical protein
VEKISVSVTLCRTGLDQLLGLWVYNFQAPCFQLLLFDEFAHFVGWLGFTPGAPASDMPSITARKRRGLGKQ